MITTPAQTSVDPIISRLRPRTVVEILDQAFRLYRKHFLTFLAIIAVVHMPVQLLVQGFSVALLGQYQGVLEETQTGTYSSADVTELFISLGILYGAILGLSLLSYVLQFPSQVALTAAVADSHMDRPISFAGAYRSMTRHLGSLLGAMLLQLLVVIAPFVPIILLFGLAFAALVGSGGASGDAAGGALAVMCLGFLLMIPAFVLYIFLYVRLWVVVPALMVENLAPVQAFRRSWGLIQNYWWRTAAIFFILGMLGAIVAAGPGYAVAGVVALFLRDMDQVAVSAIVSGVGVFTTMFFIPLQQVATTLYYFDKRVRKEGFDLETALNQRYAPAPPPPGSYEGQPQYAPTAGAAAPPPVLGYETQGVAAYGQSYSIQPPQAYTPARVDPSPQYTQPVSPDGDVQQSQQGTVDLSGDSPTLPAIQPPQATTDESRLSTDENRER